MLLRNFNFLFTCFLKEDYPKTFKLLVNFCIFNKGILTYIGVLKVTFSLKKKIGNYYKYQTFTLQFENAIQ